VSRFSSLTRLEVEGNSRARREPETVAAGLPLRDVGNRKLRRKLRVPTRRHESNRVAQGFDWLFVEHINHLHFFRDASGEYTRGFASSFQGYLVTPIAIVYGALAGGFVVSWLNWGDWQSSVVSGIFGLFSLLLFLTSGVYGLCICKKENEARLMLTSILMVPQVAP
jgi:hypothetical protein